jgi:uncharacterized Zn-binding protein involved in type VI secretion
MSQPAACVGDLHTCPCWDGPKPHIGGPLLPPGAPTVLIAGRPATRIGDAAMCIGPLSSVVSGAATVLIGGKPAARLGDQTAHGGTIVSGVPNVLIG